MDTDSIIREIKNSMTGDPKKDGPFLKSQSEKYKDDENSAEINRDLAKLLYQCSYDDMHKTIDNFLASENPKVNEKLKEVRKRFANLNFDKGIEILKEIIRNNLFAWEEDDDKLYKSFGTPLEHALYIQIYSPDKKVCPVTCDLSGVYSLYGLGLFHKKRFTESLDAFGKALDLNPVDPEIYLNYCELLKQIKQPDELKSAVDKMMRCAVTKEQLGKGYFNYSYYFSEKNKYDKASAMLEMSRIFCNDKKLIENELKYIAGCTGIGALPPKHSKEQLLEIMRFENIPAGPSELVINTAYYLAKHSHQQLDYEMAKYYYETVWELTESDDVKEIIDEIDITLRDIKENR